MLLHRFVPVVRTMALLALVAGVSSAATFSFMGSFNQDDDVRYFQFQLNNPGDVTLLTYSYGGGTNGMGMAIPAGGFEPIVSLFNSTGTLLNVSGPNGVCPPQNVDSATGLCVDAYVEAPSLASGSYTVALTQFFNVPNGPTLANGFLQGGTGNFTGPSCSDAGGSFLDETCSQRTNAFALDITGVDSATASPAAIPEPSTYWLLGSGLSALVIHARRRRA